MSTSFVVVAKRDCPTCDLVQPVLHEIAASGAALTVYTQDDPAFPAGPGRDRRPFAGAFVAPRCRDGTDSDSSRRGRRDRAHGGLGPRGVDPRDRARPARGRPPRIPAGMRLEERGPRHAGDSGGGVRSAAADGAGHRCTCLRGRARAVLLPRLERRAAGGPADPRSGAAHARGNDARSAAGDRRDPAEQCTVHRREGRNQRSDGGLQARVHAGRPRSGGGGARARVRNARPALHHMVLGPDGGRERPDRTPDRHEFRCERSRSGQPGKCEYRARVAARDPQRRRRGSGWHRPGDARLAGEVHPVLRRGRIRIRTGSRSAWSAASRTVPRQSPCSGPGG